VISSGLLFKKQVEGNESRRALFHYKLKDAEMAPACKIGFIVGHFPHIHKMSEVIKDKSSYAFFIN
jgi:hypothetical protein